MAGPLPGLPAQMRMASQLRPGMEFTNDPDRLCRNAGVLALLYPGGSPLSKGRDLHIVLTQRTEWVSNHRGQISLPGGQVEPGESAVQAALREAHEELRIDPEQIVVLGQLTPLYIPPSGYCIYPVVAYASRRPEFSACADEVADVIEAPVTQLLASSTRVEEMWTLRGAPVSVPFYAVNGYKVWGATAMVLSELLALISSVVTPD